MSATNPSLGTICFATMPAPKCASSHSNDLRIACDYFADSYESVARQTMTLHSASRESLPRSARSESPLARASRTHGVINAEEFVQLFAEILSVICRAFAPRPCTSRTLERCVPRIYCRPRSHRPLCLGTAHRYCISV